MGPAPTALPPEAGAGETVVGFAGDTAVPPGDSESPIAVTPAAGAVGPTLTVDDAGVEVVGTAGAVVGKAVTEVAEGTAEGLAESAADGAVPDGAAADGAVTLTVSAEGVPVGAGAMVPPNAGTAFAAGVPDGVVPEGVAPNGGIDAGARMSVPPMPGAAPTGDGEVEVAGEVLTGGVPRPPPVTPPGPGPDEGTDGWVCGGLTCASATASPPSPGAPATASKTAT